MANAQPRWSVVEVDLLKRDINPRMNCREIIATTQTQKQAELVAEAMRNYHRGGGRYTFEVEKDEPGATKRRRVSNGSSPNNDAFAPWRIQSGGLPGSGKRR